MKNNLLALGAIWFALLGGGPASGQMELLHTGTSWNLLSEPMKVGYVMGFLDGLRRGEVIGLGSGTGLCEAAMSKTLNSRFSSPMTKAEEGRLDDALSKVAKDNFSQVQESSGFLPLSNVPLGKITTGLDTFYGDGRNAPICWVNALAFSAQSLAGHAPDESAIDATRKADAQSGCK